jgi:hypothetical protein
MIRNLGIVALAATLAGCAVERAVVAQQAQNDMIGMSREQILGCMGPPINKAAEGATEAWSYSTNPTMNMDRGSGQTRYCVVTILMTSGHVSAVRYQGPSGGLISEGEQCAYAVNACLKRG